MFESTYDASHSRIHSEDQVVGPYFIRWKSWPPHCPRCGYIQAIHRLTVVSYPDVSSPVSHPQQFSSIVSNTDPSRPFFVLNVTTLHSIFVQLHSLLGDARSAKLLVAALSNVTQPLLPTQRQGRLPSRHFNQSIFQAAWGSCREVIGRSHFSRHLRDLGQRLHFKTVCLGNPCIHLIPQILCPRQRHTQVLISNAQGKSASACFIVLNAFNKARQIQQNRLKDQDHPRIYK